MNSVSQIAATTFAYSSVLSLGCCAPLKQLVVHQWRDLIKCRYTYIFNMVVYTYVVNLCGSAHLPLSAGQSYTQSAGHSGKGCGSGCGYTVCWATVIGTLVNKICPEAGGEKEKEKKSLSVCG